MGQSSPLPTRGIEEVNPRDCLEQEQKNVDTSPGQLIRRGWLLGGLAGVEGFFAGVAQT